MVLGHEEYGRLRDGRFLNLRWVVGDVLRIYLDDIWAEHEAREFTGPHEYVAPRYRWVQLFACTVRVIRCSLRPDVVVQFVEIVLDPIPV